jgi:NADH dehydrogenase
MARAKVLIIGGGFGGLSAARALKRADVDVTLVDRLNHHLFQPLLYQVATGILSDGQIAPPLRWVFRDQKNLRVHLAEVTGFDLGDKQVRARSPDGGVLTLGYDFLIVAAGSTHTYFGHDEWEAFAPGLKSLTDAHRLRAQILGAFELAAEAKDGAERERWLTFVTVGGGPTGVELTGQIAELARRLLTREYRTIHAAKARIVLLDAGSSLLASFPEKLQRRARDDLERMGAEIRTHAKVTAVDADGVEIEGEDGETSHIPAKTVVWAAGVAASPLARMLADASGARTDRAGRIEVNPDCTLPGRPEVFAVGDMNKLDDLPGVAQPAIQEGRYAARQIRRRLKGKAPDAPFHYFDKGTLAAIGHRNAVADVFGLKLGGVLAALIWGLVHVAYLVGWGNRLGTVGRWLWGLALRDRRELAISADSLYARAEQHGPTQEPGAHHVKL